MKQFGSWFFMCLIVVLLLAVAVGVADMAGRPCQKVLRIGQAAAGGTLAQYYDANGNEVYTGDQTYYYEEPCYDTSYTQPTYDETYYYEESPYSYEYYDTYDVGSYGYYDSSPGTYRYSGSSVWFTPTPAVPGEDNVSPGYFAGGPALTQSVIPIGVPTPPLYFPQTYGQASQVTVVAPPISTVSPVVISAPVQTYGQAYLPPLYQTPSCFISAGATQILAGDTVTVAWASNNATAAYLLGAGSVGTAGSYQFAPASSQTYTLNVFGPGGSSSCAASVNVVARPASAPAPQAAAAPGCAISADPASIFEGGTSILSWSSSRTTSASLSGIGIVAVKGSRSVSPKSTQRYILTATGEGGTRSCSVTVEVRSTTSCTVTCNGVTYACAPVNTPVSAACPQTGTVTAPDSSGGVFDSFWQWLTGIF